MRRKLAETSAEACYRRGSLAERMVRRAEMARTEATEGHWEEMKQLVRNYESSARSLRREGGPAEALAKAIALAITTDTYATGRARGKSDRRMVERAETMKALAVEAAGALRRGCS
jgi:hypothetical protein